jgi:hypothetical protein
MHTPTLMYNGAEDPDRWRPYPLARVMFRVPQVGDLLGWRYGGWRVDEATQVARHDLHADDQETLDRVAAGVPPERRESVRRTWTPWNIVIRHEHGPLIKKPGERFQTLHTGATTAHFTVKSTSRSFDVLTEPFPVCSCHGHIWPCQEMDLGDLVERRGLELDKVVAGHADGICYACCEPISTRQKYVTFPEPSFLLPGFTSPVFHAGRAACWSEAEDYERKYRLAADLDAPRFASCPGVRFIHEGRGLSGSDRLECTAGLFCTGHHGPSGYRHESACYHKIHLASNMDGAYPRPSRDCGYRNDDHGIGCLAADLSHGGTSLSPVAADVIWAQNQKRGWRT